ncbi:MAG: hypothetical protein J6K12_04410 [Clostridia bacterium]|nr:hypothetical protein [Clostridia bacterium]
MAKKIAPMFCPVCNAMGFKNVGTENAGFSVGKAAIGVMLVGPAGVVGGALGKKQTRYICTKCGYSALYDM